MTTTSNIIRLSDTDWNTIDQLKLAWKLKNRSDAISLLLFKYTYATEDKEVSTC